MKTGRCFALALVLATLMVATGAAEARRAVRGGPFGLGVVVGQPTGITAQWFQRGGGFGQAVELAVGLDVLDEDNLYVHLNWKFYLTELATTADFHLPLYVGIGGFVFDHGHNGDDFHLGARAPLGIAFEFHGAPIEIYLELALYAIVVTDHDHDHDNVDLAGALGFRYYF